MMWNITSPQRAPPRIATTHPAEVSAEGGSCHVGKPCGLFQGKGLFGESDLRLIWSVNSRQSACSGWFDWTDADESKRVPTSASTYRQSRAAVSTQATDPRDPPARS